VRGPHDTAAGGLRNALRDVAGSGLRTVLGGAFVSASACGCDVTVPFLLHEAKDRPVGWGLGAFAQQFARPWWSAPLAGSWTTHPRRTLAELVPAARWLMAFACAGGFGAERSGRVIVALSASRGGQRESASPPGRVRAETRWPREKSLLNGRPLKLRPSQRLPGPSA